jgi:hypothetical protein
VDPGSLNFSSKSPGFWPFKVHTGYTVPSERLNIIQMLRWRRVSGCEGWSAAEDLDEPSQVLRSRGKQHLVSCAAQAPQPKLILLQDELHMRNLAPMIAPQM